MRSDAAPPRVVVVGSLNMDLIVRVPRLPGPGETVLGQSLAQAAGGKGANQAVAAARLGASVAMVGHVGRDAFGRELARGLRAEGISTRHLRAIDEPTGAALIEVDQRGENTIAVAPGANARLRPQDVPPRLVGGADVVVAQLEVPLDTVAAAFGLARAAGVATVLNAAPARRVPPELLQLCDAVVLNEHELAALLGADATADATDAGVARGPEMTSGGQAEAARGAHSTVDWAEVEAARTVRCTPRQVIVVTLGARGALAVTGDEVVRQASFGVDVVDTVGAGDAFVGGFAAGRWWSAGLAGALRLGCAAGALATTRSGAQPSLPSLAQVQALLTGVSGARSRGGGA